MVDREKGEPVKTLELRAKDGRLLLFEADVALIVHAMDPPDLYPYKVPAMAKLFAAFRDMLGRTSRR